MIESLLRPEVLPLVLAGATTVALALVLAVLDITRRSNRTFAALLLFVGASILLGTLSATASSGPSALYLQDLAPYLVLPVPFLLVHFLSVFPRPRGLARMRGGWLAMVALAAAALLAYLLDHTLYARTALTGATNPTGGAVVALSGFGPLALFFGLRRPALAVAAVVLARESRRDRSGSGGYSTFLLFCGFAVNAIFDGVAFTTDFVEGLASGASPVRQPGGWMQFGLPAATLPIAAVAVAEAARALREGGERALHTRRFLAYVLPLVVLSGFAVSFDPWGGKLTPALPFVIGLWRLAVPLLLAYALMRYSLFDLDVRIKAGVRRAILVVLFVGVFFLVSEAAEAIVSADRAPLFGVVSASLLAVAGKPLQVFAERAANGVMPETQPVHRLGSQARFRLYREQFELVQQDGRVTPKERRMLGRLAASLGIDEDESMDLEAGVVPARDDPPPPRSRRSASRIARSVAAILGTGTVFGALAAAAESWAGASSFLTGLMTAAAVALLLGPIESMAERLASRRSVPAASEAAMRDALRDAWADGSLSERDRAFLDALQRRLGMGRRDRRRIEREVKAAAD